ncbi:MAG: hypothetical protein GY795_10245 [Desulfobacterales bacterium]|nr:hypothetical protein [Desulfobacterales bacterium]
MAVVRIWALESDYDKDTVGKLAGKLIDYFDIKNVSVRTSGKRAYNTVAKRKKTNGFKIAVESYLRDEDKLIFVIDSDSEASLAERRKEPDSLINQVEKIMNLKKFSDKVYLAIAIQELEAWLLTDCIGICCYFARTRYKNNCREKIMCENSFQSVIGKYQKGNTELIVEAVRGGKGAKEYLVRFSKEILKTLNPKMKPRNIDTGKYREALSPEIADYIEINNEILKRNKSFQKFKELLSGKQKI